MIEFKFREASSFARSALSTPDQLKVKWKFYLRAKKENSWDRWDVEAMGTKKKFLDVVHHKIFFFFLVLAHISLEKSLKENSAKIICAFLEI